MNTPLDTITHISTTRRGFIQASITPHPPVGNSSTIKRHNHPSGQRGEAHSQPSRSATAMERSLR